MRVLLCVFIDAFGWELAKRHSFLDDILVQRIPLDTVFGYSSTCDPTILTGRAPREHGHFAFYAYDPANSPFRYYRVLSLLPSFLTRRGRVRSKMSTWLKPLHGFTGYFQLYNMPFRFLHLFNYTEQKNIFERGGINSGIPTIFDYVRDRAIPYCRPETFDEQAAIDETCAAIERGDVRFAYLFLGRLDAILHAKGTSSPDVSAHIAWYEAQVRRLYDLAKRRYDDVTLFVFSDHGMTGVTETCDLMGRIDTLGLTFGKDYTAVFDSTMARFWFLADGAREAVVRALEGEPRGHVMTPEELAQYGCDFPRHEYGELFFLMDPGVLICPSHMGVKPLAAMHGYAPGDKDSVAAFMSNVPLSPPPKSLADLYAAMHERIPLDA